MMKTSCSLTAWILLATAVQAQAADWPAWRGPDGNGIAKDAHPPVTWGADKNIAWKLAMPGKAGSTPIVWKDKIFLTSSEDNDLILLCASTEGKELWKRKIAKAVRLAIKYDEANEASASPTTDGKHVFAFVGSGHLACFDFEGNEKWKFNVQERYGAFKIQHGLHTCPLLHEDRLYLALLHNGGNLVVALDKTNGKEIWKVDRISDAKGESREAYASPLLWQDGKDPCVVILGSDYTTAHRLKDGSEIWRLGDLNPKEKGKYSPALRIIATPVVGKDMLLVPTARGGLVVALKPNPQGNIGVGSDSELWRIAKGSPDVPSPLVHDGIVYIMGDGGVLLTLDAKTGAKHYSQRLHDSRYRSSPVLADGKVYLSARDGTFHVVKTGPKYELLSENLLPDVFTSSPAIAGNRLYLRGFNHLYAIEEGKK